MTNIYSNIISRGGFPASSMRIKYFPFVGGEILTDPALSQPPGSLLYGKNYEVYPEGGYRRIDGYERFDGRTKPSESLYWILEFQTGTAASVDTNVITGATSGATAELIADAVVESGSYAGSDAVGYMAVALLTGTFTVGENIQVSASTVAVVKTAENALGATTDALDTTYSRASIERARSKIGTVTGSGPIRGVWVYSGSTYAFRDNVGATECKMYKSSTSGWTAVDLGQYIKYNTGSAAVSEGDTLTGATSGATGTVRRITITTGAIGTSNATGVFVLTGVSGTFQSGENLQVSSSTVAVSTSALATIALVPGGRYEFVNYNFGGSTSTNRMYWVDGFNTAFEWDGTYAVPLFTGMSVDTPRHIAAHKKHLFLAFQKGSLQHSSIGDPYGWSVITGASEIGTGGEITGLQVQPGDAMAVFNRNRIYVLYGTSSSSWNLKTFSNDSGAGEYTVQNLTETMFLDDRGVTTLSAVNAYGDFAMNSISKKIRPIISDKKGLSISSVRVRAKGQYRLFFNDGTGIYATFSGNKIAGFIRIDLGKVVYTICSAEDALGDEILFFGSDDGYIYQMDKGTSFDGSSIEAMLRLSYYHYDSPTRDKRFRKIQFEMTADSSVSVQFSPDYSYSDPNVPEARTRTLSIDGSGGYWNINNWDSFNWTGQIISTSEENLDGIGTNMGMLILSEATYEQPHIIQGVTVHYSPRRVRR
jgi:hypothetical protein